MQTKTQLRLLIPALFLSLGLASCSGDDDAPGPSGTCLADKITLAETLVDDLESVSAVQVTFDAKNTGSQDYDIAGGSKPIYAEIKVTMTDNSVYTEEQPLLASKLVAGATAAVTQSVDYGPGKTYKSYSIRIYCK